ncbi:hypothetical protein SLEP1_g55038 [Rubroshorea leprosula]|uniref:Uncharacterized protein n=1 Tax=Rubroshorea leprosula TaxID=152421 RepID=A0AAV5MFE9_9ROSI|nr:hypothetical protein SLEP1_g55038 [Rubroshorea leprosula]
MNFEEMSSKETVSVVGSEEVRALEYGDVGMTSESSDSEKTEEGVGRSEMVGVEGDRVPITVVEVEGRNERCYDVDADIMFEVKHYESELETRDSLNYSIGLTQLAPNAMRGGSRKDKGWYYFTPKVSNKESRSLFTMGPSSIKGWKEKFFFVDDIEWERGDAKVELLSSWKAKKANQNKYSLNEDEEEEVEKLVREGGNLVNIMYLTIADCIEAAELCGPNALSEGLFVFCIVVLDVGQKVKSRKKSKTSTKKANEVEARKELVLSTSTGVKEEVRGSEVLQFIPRPPLVELDPELKESEAEGAGVRAPGKGKGLVPQLSFQSSLFDAKNSTGARRFINATFPEVNALAQEFMESVKDRSLLQRQCEQLQKEKEELEKKNKDMQEALDEVVPTVKQLEEKRDSLSTKLVFEEKKRKISKIEREAQEKEIKAMKEVVVELKKNVQLLVHNGMEEHISNFVNSSSFDNIVNLYRLPTAILAFTDCRKKVKAEYPEVNITKITFGKQEEEVEENGESMSANFRPQIKLRWDRDVQGRTVFPPNFDFEFVAVEEEEAEVKGAEVGAKVKGTEVDESQPPLQVEVHPVPSDDEQPPLRTEQQPPQPPPPAKE